VEWRERLLSGPTNPLCLTVGEGDACIANGTYRSSMDGVGAFGTLDYLYMPSRDVAADVQQLVDALEAKVVFAIDDGGTRVAMVALGVQPPHVVLTDHLEGDAPILVYRVDDVARHQASLEQNGVQGWRLELPMGPAFSFSLTGGQRVAIYESTRPGVVAHFEGRRDF
jgi:hypothetical protein